jgi:class 3 adenylate cyclase/tetratricopeptide (TPR) repeat protein
MITDIGEWLRSLDLEQYLDAFRDNEIDDKVLAKLTADDLKEIGVVVVGHRRRMLSAIAELSSPPAVQETAEIPAFAIEGLASRTNSEGERRQLTVMFCDLVGSTALAAQLDPEDMSDLIRAFQKTVAAAVARFDGHVAKLMGDGALVYFGYPSAHEDDAERAVRAGLTLVEAVGGLRRDRGLQLEVRAGIATGVVVVGELMGEGEARERGVVGETPNLAARLQGVAKPGDVVIAESTRRLLGGVFQLRAMDFQILKGFPAPVQAWAVLHASDNLSRFEATRSRMATPFVGREHETALLVERWRDACEGEGQVALLSGEAGIGKSRILAALRERISAEPHVTVRYQCSPHHINEAFYPITSQMWHAAGFVAGEAAAAMLDKLEALIERSDLKPEKYMPYLATLLSIPIGESLLPPDMPPSEVKERTISTLIAMFAGLAKETPLLALLEDAHWIDPTTLDVFNRVVERLPNLRGLLVVTYRPEFTPPWIGLANVASLSLSRLGRRQAREMIDRATGGKALPADVLEQIIAKTDGVPLFLEELVKTVLESGLMREENGVYVLNSALTPLAIPSTLHDSLMARLDRLAPVKGTAQIGAAIGREFSYRLLEAVSPIKGASLREALNQLIAAELIHGRGYPPESTYVFKHALVQDTAYASLLKSRRQQLHQQIGEAVRDSFPEQADSEPGVIAHHFTRAGLSEQAVEWWGRSGRRAMSRFANLEAVQSFTSALTLVSQMPKSDEIQRQELLLRLALGPALLATRGYASAEAEWNYDAAHALAESLGEREAAFVSARGLWNCFYDRGDQNRSLVLAERLRNLSKENDRVENQALALRALGSTRMNRAEYAQSLEAFDECIAVSANLPLGVCIDRHGEEPRIVATQYRGLVLCMKGFSDEALEVTRSAVALARRSNHPLSQAFASSILCIVLQLRRDLEACEALAKEQIAHCEQQGFNFWLAAYQVHHGVALAHLFGRGDGAIEAERGITNWINTGAIIHVPTWSAFLADAALASGEIALAEKALSRGLEAAKKNGEVFALAELQRLTGRLLLTRNLRDEARAFFNDAATTARGQGAILYLLRAVSDLGRLLAENGERPCARDLLHSVVEDFPEHRDGKDFLEASELLSSVR